MHLTSVVRTFVVQEKSLSKKCGRIREVNLPFTSRSSWL